MGAYETALAAIDSAHAEDPRMHNTESGPVPYELHYARKMTQYLEKREPNASETLRLAIRAQHFRRWEVPRDSYPMTKPGYYAWRTGLKKRQGEQTAQICLTAGYSQADCDKIAAMIRKEEFKKDQETQILEDVACLVFLDDQFEAFRKEHNEEKLLNIIKKTWSKMSAGGHQLALQIDMSESAQTLILKALAS